MVRKADDVELDAALATAQGLAPGLDTQSWRSLMPTIATYLDSARQMMGIVSAVFYIVIAILVLNAMLMAVFERIREFGVLKALGVEPRQVLWLIFLESALQTGLALGIGLVISAPTLWYLVEVGIDTGALGGVTVMGASFATVWQAAVTPATFATPAMTLILLVLVAVVYPALKAARISPVEAMRYQ